MPFYEAEAFALRDYDLGEADKIIVLYTNKYGKVRAVAQGAKRLKSRFGSSFEPLTHLKLSFYEKEGAELAKITQCDILNSPYRMEPGIHATVNYIYFAELVLEFTPERDANENIFRLILASLEAIKEGSNTEYITRYFETWLMKLEGLLPKYDVCSKCGSPTRGQSIRFSPQRLEVTCTRCKNSGGFLFSAGVTDLIDKIVHHHPAEFAKFNFDQKNLWELEQINQRLIAHHLGKSIKSYATIKQLRI